MTASSKDCFHNPEHHPTPFSRPQTEVPSAVECSQPPAEGGRSLDHLPYQRAAAAFAERPQHPQVRAAYVAALERAQHQARALADQLLHATWRRLLGPVWRLVHELLRELLFARLTVCPEAEHAFATYEDLAARLGRSTRTIERRLRPRCAERARWLAMWLSHRVQYMTRADGLPCRAGTVWRVNTSPIEPLRAQPFLPGPTRAALKAAWRRESDLPSARREEENLVEDDVEPLTDNVLVGIKTFPPKERLNFKTISIKVEGLSCNFQSTFGSNSRHTGVARRVNELAQQQALSVAEAIEARLPGEANGRNRLFWLKVARWGLKHDRLPWVFSAVDHARAARVDGILRRSEGAYVVGVLERGGFWRPPEAS